MNKKLISSLLAGLALSAAAVVPAQAAPMSLVAGSITIYFDGMLDQGTAGYNDPLQALGTTATLCSTVAGCDAPLGQTTGAQALGSDTWGIFSVSRIVSNVSGNDLWERNVTTTSGVGRYLSGYFYGLQDFRVDYTVSATGNPSIETYSSGGQVDLYWNAATINTATILSSNRTAVSDFTGITDTGVKAVSLAFNPTADAVEPASSYRSSYNYTSTGSGGQGYLDVIDGSGDASDLDFSANTINLAAAIDQSASLLDPLTQDPLGVFHDVALYTEFGVATTAQKANGWTVRGSGHADSNIPEPGSMALAGLGLIGLAALRRRKQQA